MSKVYNVTDCNKNRITFRIFFRKILNVDNFFFHFASKLDESFPNGWICTSVPDEVIIGVEGTVGWYKALKETLEKFGLEECWKYYDGLYWEESKVVDGLIGRLTETIVFDENCNRVK